MAAHPRVKRWSVAAALAASAALGAWHLLRLVPGPGGSLGHDWSYFLRQMLAGSFWMLENGVADVPWFTPAWLGGVPFHPNPQNVYWSLPQLCRIVDPLTAAQITVAASVAVAHVGAYLLLRRTFGASRPAALVGAVLFGWNGYLASRLLIGHVVYHTFALVPVLALCVLGRRSVPPTRASDVRRGVAGGVVLAMMVRACDLHGVPVAVLATFGLWCVLAAAGRSPVGAWRRGAIAAVTGMALSASKLVAMLAFLGRFPRSGYTLPGTRGIGESFQLVGAALFGRAPTELAQRVLVNLRWAVERHELEYGVTPVAALLLVAGAVAIAVRRPRVRPAPLACLALVALLPVALNVHTPAWERVIKGIPLLGSGSLMVRLISLLVPLACVGAALAVDALAKGRRVRTAVAAVALVAAVSWHVSGERDHYVRQPFRSELLVAAWKDAQRNGEPPRIVQVHRGQGTPGAPIRTNDLADGVTRLDAFEPIFGYRLEWFPASPVRPGPALPPDGAPNVHDPSRFLWPDENGGPPGSTFPAARRDDARAFLAYRPFPFRRSLTQRIADLVNALALLGVAALGAWTLWRCVRR